MVSFDAAWASSGSAAHELIRHLHESHHPGKANRDDMTQIEQLRDDALAHLQNNPLFQVTWNQKCKFGGRFPSVSEPAG
jgi:hypothetical protein